MTLIQFTPIFIRYLLIMRTALLALLLVLAPSISYAREYGHYDLNRIRTISEGPSGKKYAIDKQYLDQVLHDLGFHARNYPPQFDNPEDQRRAVQDAIAVSGMLDAVIVGPKPDTDLLVRAGFLGMIGKNLNITGSAQKADSNFKRSLKAAPSDPLGNFLYGTFLAGEGKLKRAIPYLEKALASGESDAAYTLGMVYKTLGNSKKAIDNLEIYRKSSPYNEQTAATLIAEIENSEAKKKGNKK